MTANIRAMSVMALSSCTPVRRGSCSECAQCLDDQVALRFCRRKQIDVLLCRSDVRVARWQSGNLFRQLARCPLKVESHGAVPFLLDGGPMTMWMRAVGLSINCFLAYPMQRSFKSLHPVIPIGLSGKPKAPSKSSCTMRATLPDHLTHSPSGNDLR